MKQWICKYCGGDTKCTDMDYLDGYDHISCILKMIDEAKKPKVMKIKGWEKISGYTYKGYAIVNPIHNAEETRYEATILDLNLPHKPKWELSVLTPNHKFLLGSGPDVGTFSIIMKDDENRSTINTIEKQRMASISSFRNIFEEMIDKLLGMRLTSAPVYSSHSLQTGTINPNYYATNTIGGILANVNNNGTFSIYDSSTGTSFDLVDTIKTLQKQIDDLKQNTPTNPF